MQFAYVRFWLVGCLSCLGCGQAEESAAVPNKAEVASVSAPAQPRPRAVLEQEASEALRDKLRSSLSRRRDAVTQTVTANGKRGVRFNGRFQHGLMARVGKDGRLEYGCFGSADSAEHFADGHTHTHGVTP